MLFPIISRNSQDASLLEGSVRLSLEESDSVQVRSEYLVILHKIISRQGLQVLNDTASFGPFIHSLLTALHDDMLKIPCLAFPLLSNTNGWDIDVEDV